MNKAQREQSLTLSAIQQTARVPYAPPMIWIARYPPLWEPDAQTDLNGYAETAWFLDESGLRRENVWKWQRFVTVWMHRPYFTGMGVYPDSIFGRTHEIGYATFAPYENSDLYYLETVWGGTSGMGSVLTFEPSSRHLQKRLWVS